MKRLLVLIALFLIPNKLEAQNLCTLDTTNPALSHGVFKIHGVGFQGITQYNGPAEWPMLSFQDQWVKSNSAQFDASKGLLNPALGHTHIEPCYPYLADIDGPITLPFQVVVYHSSATVNAVFGPMVRDIVWDNNLHLPFTCTETEICTFPGHFTYDPALVVGGGSPGIDSAIVNGWTNFTINVATKLASGDTITNRAFTPLFTHLSNTAPEVPIQDSMPKTAEYAFIDAVHDTTGAWGTAVLDIRGWALPLLKPFNVRWDAPTMDGYSYGAATELQVGIKEMRKDMDLHHGIDGTRLNSFGYFDPVEIGPGKHKIAMIWTVNSGNGIPGTAIPDEVINSLVVINIEVGDVAVPTTCTDPLATNFGGPLPCTYPPPPIWSSGFIFWKPNPMTFELCPANDPLDLACQVQ